MEIIKLGPIESRFADIIWANEPISSGELAQKCLEQLQWKRTTTYTVLKKLSERGLFQKREGNCFLPCFPAGILLQTEPAVCGRGL